MPPPATSAWSNSPPILPPASSRRSTRWRRPAPPGTSSTSAARRAAISTTGVAAARLFVRNNTLTVRMSRDPLARADAKDKTRKETDCRAGQRWRRHCAGRAARRFRDIRRGGSVRGRARRQQSRGPRRRAHDRSRRAAAAGEAAGRQRPAAHDRPLPHADQASRFTRRVSRLTCTSPEPDVDFGADPPAGDAALDKAIERLSAAAEEGRLERSERSRTISNDSNIRLRTMRTRRITGNAVHTTALALYGETALVTTPRETS